MSNSNVSSRWIRDFEVQLLRRKHIVLYGNIHDIFLWNSRYLNVQEFLVSYFKDMGFGIITKYDPVEGFSFFENGISDDPPDEKLEPLTGTMRERFQAIISRNINNKISSPDPVNEPACNIDDLTDDDLTAPPPRATPAATLDQSSPNVFIPPLEAFASLQMVLRQDNASIAAIVDIGDMLTTHSDNYSPDERNALIFLKKCTQEAAVLAEPPLSGYRNTMVLVANNLKRVPEWFYLDNPNVAFVHVRLPDKDERLQFARDFLRPQGDDFGGFFGGEKISAQGNALEQISEELADVTEGFTIMDLEALRTTSFTASIPVESGKVNRLVDYFKFGIQEDAWEKLDVHKVKQAREFLSKEVIGQPKAVDAVVNMLIRSKIGLTMYSGNKSTKPKGVFFFVGPTGVGKTELAKAVTKLVFSDDRAFARFDMSEYTEQHAAEKLAGAPPGFVGYEEGGQLTNRVLEHPHSILLFDEIEKAHQRVLDKFLQILEDGRLTDGKGQTAYFNQTAIIFTSNIGASAVLQRISAEGGVAKFSPERVVRIFKDAVKEHFIQVLNRAELLNRLGDNIVVFDFLRPEYVSGICEKFLNMLASTAKDRFNLDIRYSPSVIEFIQHEMIKEDNLMFGGRRIKSELERLIELPLNQWIFEESETISSFSGMTIELNLSSNGKLEVKNV